MDNQENNDKNTQMDNQENSDKIAQEEQLKIARKLADTYGNEMRLHGMSLEWTSPRECPDTTEKLMNNPDFQSLSSDLRKKILNHGHNMKVFGLGCYQENTYASRYYDDCHGQPPKNPFSESRPMPNESQSNNSTPGQLGE